MGDPHSSALKGEKYRAFRELRCDCGKQHHRIIFRRSDRFFILLHIILHKEGEIPEQDKRVALDRWNDFVARMDANPTARPRAMGNDAGGRRQCQRTDHAASMSPASSTTSKAVSVSASAPSLDTATLIVAGLTPGTFAPLVTSAL